MSNVPSNRPRGLAHLLLHRRVHPSWRTTLIELGYASSAIYLGLVFLVYWIPGILHAILVWIIIIYIALQLLETLLRDPLDIWDGIKDDLLSLAPAVAGLVLRIGFGSYYSGEGKMLLVVLTIVAWLEFIFGLLLPRRMLTTPYQREEFERQGPPE